MKKSIIILILIVLCFSFTQVNAKGTTVTYVGEGLTIVLSSESHAMEDNSLTCGDYEELNYEISDSNLRKFNCFYFCLFYLVEPRYSAMNNQMYYIGNDDASKFLKYGNYLTSGVYEQTDRFHADLIAYYNQNNELIHMGHVVEAYKGTSNNVCGDSNLVKVISKWGSGKIYKHQGDCCPYTSTNGGAASFVIYYKYCRFHTCTHVFDIETSQHYCKCDVNSQYCNFQLNPHNNAFSYTKYNANYHTKVCTICDYNVHEAHTWQRISDILFKCSLCGQKATYIEDYHDSIISINKNMIFTIYCDGNYYTVKLCE